MVKLHRKDSWPMNHRNQVPIIEDIRAQIAMIHARLNELSEFFSPRREDDKK